ncbi:MAG: hypothetical protein ACOC42_00235, partial [Halobacteriota archaeon]
MGAGDADDDVADGPSSSSGDDETAHGDDPQADPTTTPQAEADDASVPEEAPSTDLEPSEAMTKLEDGEIPDEHAPPAIRRSTSEPPDDVEMPLTEHIEEMLSRLVIV